MNTLDFGKKQRLLELLLECPGIQNTENRRALTAELPRQVADTIEFSNQAKVHALNIVNTCMNHAGAFARLVEALRFFDGGTKQFQALTKFVSGIPGLETGREEIETPIKKPYIFSDPAVTHCFVEIQKRDQRYSGLRQQGNTVRKLEDLNLGPQAEITIEGRRVSLGTLTSALSRGREDGQQSEDDQLVLGEYLYEQLFAKQRPGAGTVLHIITRDEHIAHLPWMLLAHEKMFLSANAWSIVISRGGIPDDCELSDSPRMLVIAPQPANMPATHADSHLETLENNLSVYNPSLVRGKHLRIVDTWEAFTASIKTFAPDIVYYYGHGASRETENACLLFSQGKPQGKQDRSLAKPVAEFAACLRALPQSPQVVYVNLCQGENFTETGRQLEAFVPAVIVSRVAVDADTAQAQAMSLWESLLLKGCSPHQAMIKLSGGLRELNVSGAEARRTVPVLYAHYAKWRATRPEPVDRERYDPHWHLKIDRIAQFSIIDAQSRQMLRERKPRGLAFVWYGRKGDGVDLFHHRLNVELCEGLGNTFFYEVRPQWPLELENPHRSFQDMLTEAFEVAEFEDIPLQIRKKTQGAFGKQTLVYVRHAPVETTRLINPKTLKIYLQWWDNTFLPQLESQQFALLGVSFVVKNPGKFQSVMQEKECLEEEDFRHMAFHLLDEMENLARRDLQKFLRTHNIDFPPEVRNKVLDKILSRTGGKYEQTIEELKNLRELAWAMAAGKKETGTTQKEEYDY
ncbi:MAG: hypothetical protein GY862_24180 [Gammaproteobacteria bacterium]|nr:hypothetical protein [Gammaproteobacteria bacterium]